MKNTMKNQCKKFPLWGMRGLLAVALSSLGVVAFAQSVDVCAGTPYAIASTVDASGASTYQWLENGQLISGASAPTYIVPNNKAAGLYTYIRQSKSADCSEWQSSNVFTVTVYACSFTAGTATSATATFTDPRDGKRYKTVVMPDGKTWFAQNLNYTKDLTYNAYSYEANGKQFTLNGNGTPAIGSYWCPPPRYWVNGSATSPVASGSEADCRTYGALYTWETAMMVDGKYADEMKMSSTWDESWVSGNYNVSGAPSSTPNADKNNARGGNSVKGGGRGICPVGWHVPTELEWAIMLDKVEGDGTGSAFINQPDIGWWGSDAGEKLKSTGTFTHSDSDPGTGTWLGNGVTGTDLYGFGAVPAGSRRFNGVLFNYQGVYASFWTCSVSESNNSWYYQFAASYAQVNRFNSMRSHGFSVRCIKD
jgi:uncharacterized protein (TIGR02145 family)